MTDSYVWHDSFIWVTYMWIQILICVPWLIHMCDTTHSYGTHTCGSRQSNLTSPLHWSRTASVVWCVSLSLSLSHTHTHTHTTRCRQSYLKSPLHWSRTASAVLSVCFSLSLSLPHTTGFGYVLATISRLCKIIGLFCKILSLL